MLRGTVSITAPTEASDASVIRDMGDEGPRYASSPILSVASLMELKACFAASGSANFY